MKRHYGLLFAAALTCGLSVPALAAETLADFMKESTVSGNLRAYDFYRIYSPATEAAQPDQSAVAFAARIDVQTASFLDGFSVGASLFTANDFGVSNRKDNLLHLDKTLMGSNSSLTALGQAYVQYKNNWVTAKAGDQIIHTPWLDDSDSRVLPATYQGLFADFQPVENVHLIALRVFSWKSRTSSGYFHDNLYYTPAYKGDQIGGGTASTAISNRSTDGTLAFGGTYADHGLKIGLWYYDFQQFAKSIFNDSSYTLKTGTGFDPYIGDQFMRQWLGDSALNGATLNGVTGSGVDNTTYGGRIGVNSPYGQMQVAYTKIEDHQGAVGHGALVSPYTAGYASDVLDTTSMIRGMVEQGPGHAWKVRYLGKFMEEQITVISSIARYRAEVYGDSTNVQLDVAYRPKGWAKGFSVRNRLEDAVMSTAGQGGGLNAGKSKYFVYDRVQLQYDF